MARKTASRRGIRFRISPSRPLLMVEVEVNGHGPFNFVLDTGASSCVLSPDTARAADVKPSGESPIALGAGGRLEARMARVKSLRLGAHTTRNLNVALMSLHEIEKRLGVTVAGLIGYNFLRQFVVVIDYRKRLLTLRRHRARKQTRT